MSSLGPHAPLCGALLVSLSGACSDPLPPLRYETEKAVIGTDFGELCGYDLAAVDEQIEFVEDALHAESSDKVELYLYSKAPEYCGHEAVSGCYNPNRDIVVTRWSAADHELVHAVVARIAEPTPFWGEGVAEALRLHRPTIRGFVDLGQSVDATSSRGVDLLGAGHFVQWVVEEQGMASLRRVFGGGTIQAALGDTVEDLFEQYEADAPVAYPSWAPCDFPPLPEIAPGHWSEEVGVSCDRPDVSRFSERSWSLFRSVDLEGGRYEFQLQGTAAWGRLLGCLTEELHEPIMPMMHGDTMSEVEHSLTAPGVRLEAGTAHTIQLTRGRYEIEIPVDEDGQRVEISLVRVGDT